MSYPGGFAPFQGFAEFLGESHDFPDVCRYHFPVPDEDEVDGLLRVYPFGPTRPYTGSTYWIETRWARAEYL